MKKLFSVCFLIVTSLSIQAQDRRTELQNEIYDILEQATKVYSEDQGMYQQITSCKFSSDCVLEFYMHLFPVRAGEKEYDQKRGYAKYTIDFADVLLVNNKLSTTGYGYKGILISTYYAGDGGSYIGSQQTLPDQYGYHRADWMSEMSWIKSIILPTESMELITLLQEYQEICTNN